jgi:glycerol-3-phosphate dehydrogenase
MKRDPGVLSRRSWDLLVVGGGIHGAFVAREAAGRGLTTALVEKGDFASATSSQSQKIVHSGLRYLQHGDLIRVRQSLRGRTALLRMAPHLVRLLPVLVPAYGHGRRGPELLRLGLFLHDLFGCDRNRGLAGRQAIPRGRIVSATECHRLFPGVNRGGLTGGALWHDAQVTNTERFILSLLHDAARGGASLANYVEVTGFAHRGGRVAGVQARDSLTGRRFDIEARIVVNAAGPWLGRVCRLAGAAPPEPAGLSRAVVLVVRRDLTGGIAIGLPGPSLYRDPDVLVPRSERLFFITPWRDCSLVGSAHLPSSGNPDDCAVSEGEIGTFLAEVNAACPSWSIRREEIASVYRGLVPTVAIDETTGSVQVEKRQKIEDHGARDGVEGLISILGVKYTTAGEAANRAVDLAARKLGKAFPEGAAAPERIHGGEGGDLEQLLEESDPARTAPLDGEVVRHLFSNYGTAAAEVLGLLDKDGSSAARLDPASPVIAGEIVHGIRKEMALRLDDLVLRRTVLGSAGHPGERVLERCADIAARELGWDPARRRAELERTGKAWDL